jgi:hypothetical protein
VANDAPSSAELASILKLEKPALFLMRMGYSNNQVLHTPRRDG